MFMWEILFIFLITNGTVLKLKNEDNRKFFKSRDPIITINTQ